MKRTILEAEDLFRFKKKFKKRIQFDVSAISERRKKEQQQQQQYTERWFTMFWFLGQVMEIVSRCVRMAMI